MYGKLIVILYTLIDFNPYNTITSIGIISYEQPPSLQHGLNFHDRKSTRMHFAVGCYGLRNPKRDCYLRIGAGVSVKNFPSNLPASE